MAEPIVEGTAAAATPTTDRLVTVPNLLSTARLVAVPLFLWLLLGPQADGWAIAVLAASGVTDFVDGAVARRFRQISRLGQLLDPLVDRLFVVSTVLGLTVRGVLPVPLTAALLGRDLALATLLPVLRRHGQPPPQVHVMGKAATYNLLYAFPLLLLGAGANPVATPARAVGWGFAIWGTSLYWWSAVLYGIEVRRVVRCAR